jgi:hypothetical protein
MIVTIYVAWVLKLKAAIYPLLKCSSRGMVLLKKVGNASVELTARIDSTLQFIFQPPTQRELKYLLRDRLSRGRMI